jgi:hypothetical protein
MRLPVRLEDTGNTRFAICLLNQGQGVGDRAEVVQGSTVYGAKDVILR